jgi:GAF domain-containing protein
MANLYAALSRCNHAIVRSTSEQELFPQICRYAVEFSAMDMAWIGIINPDTLQVEPVASFGDDASYLNNINCYSRCRQPIGVWSNWTSYPLQPAGLVPGF